MAPKKIQLDIGCGGNKNEGFVGIDKLEAEGVDHVVDFEMEIELIYPGGGCDKKPRSTF